MKTHKSLIKALLVFVLTLILFVMSTYRYGLSPVSRDSKLIEIEVKEGTTTKELANTLKEQNLIKSKNSFYIYIKLNHINIKASTYNLSKNMGVKKIAKELDKGNNYNPNSVRITFQEGINMRRVAKIIANNTNNTYDIVLQKSNDSEFLNRIIKKYWFLTDDILNEDIYYKLEGYLYPDTYEFSSKYVTVEDIFEKMLDNEEKVLNKYKEYIYKHNYNVHEIITIASICELEGGEKYRKDIAGVFYNRLDIGMNLGSDVTTYYGAKIDMNERDINTEEINKANAYNTRSNTLNGKLPVGPISNPDKSSIEAAIYPNKHKYYYFVADKHKRVYFTKTGEEHFKKIEEIKRKGDWIEW